MLRLSVQRHRCHLVFLSARALLKMLRQLSHQLHCNEPSLLVAFLTFATSNVLTFLDLFSCCFVPAEHKLLNTAVNLHVTFPCD